MECVSVGIDSSYRPSVVKAVYSEMGSSTLGSLAIKYGFNKKSVFVESINNSKRILFLGSGDGDAINNLRKTIPQVEIVDLNPAFIGSVFRNNRLSLQLGVSGFNPELPFRDQSFGVVIDDMASIYYAHYEINPVDQLLKRILEIYRVLTDNGKAFVGPIFNKDAFEEVWASLNNRQIRFDEVSKTRLNLNIHNLIVYKGTSLN